MKVEDVKTVSIIGAGLMGHGIAQIFALAGYTVLLRDIKQDLLMNAVNRMKDNLQKLSAAGLVRKEEIDTTLSRLKTTLDMKEAVASSDFMIEAASENIDLKKQIFREADKFSPEHAILATNTSGLQIADIAAITNRPGKVIGTHFWNPPYLLRAVEVVKGAGTTDETVKVTCDLLAKVGK